VEISDYFYEIFMLGKQGVTTHTPILQN